MGYKEWVSYNLVTDVILDAAKEKNAEKGDAELAAKVYTYTLNKAIDKPGVDELFSEMVKRNYSIEKIVVMMINFSWFSSNEETDRKAVDSAIKGMRLLDKYKPSITNSSRKAAEAWDQFVIEEVGWKLRFRNFFRHIDNYYRVVNAGYYLAFVIHNYLSNNTEITLDELNRFLAHYFNKYEYWGKNENNAVRIFKRAMEWKVVNVVSSTERWNWIWRLINDWNPVVNYSTIHDMECQTVFYNREYIGCRHNRLVVNDRVIGFPVDGWLCEDIRRADLSRSFISSDQAKIIKAVTKMDYYDYLVLDSKGGVIGKNYYGTGICGKVVLQGAINAAGDNKDALILLAPVFYNSCITWGWSTPGLRDTMCYKCRKCKSSTMGDMKNYIMNQYSKVVSVRKELGTL